MFLFPGLWFLFYSLLIHCAKSDTDLLIGQPCVTEGKEGLCTPWKKCLTLALDRQDNGWPWICSFNGTDPIVCCSSCYLVEDVSKAVVGRAGGILWKNNQKSWNKCLSYMRELPYACADGSITLEKEWSHESKCHYLVQRRWAFLLNGKLAARSEFPHMALLGFGPSVDSVTEWVCSGTVISERFILTAGHCMSTGSRDPVRVAALGILKRSDPEETWQKYDIEQRIPHPGYRPPSKYHDIALLKTAKTIQFNSNVLPACLPRAPQHANEDLAATNINTSDNGARPWLFSGRDEDYPFAEAVGWGATGYREALSDGLQSVDLVAYNMTECSPYYGVHRHLRRGLDGDTQMCYGDPNEMHDTCDGDSGGPLQVRGDAIYCQYKVIGVTSFGLPCGLQKQPGVYTRVFHYVPWIESVVWPEP